MWWRELRRAAFFDPFSAQDDDVDGDAAVVAARESSSARAPPSSPRAPAAGGGGGGGGDGVDGDGGGGRAGGHLSSRDLAAALNVGASPLALPRSARDLTGSGAGAGLGGGAGADADGGRRFLAHERRGLWGQASYNVGYTYVLGLALGGAYGLVAGVRASPNASPRVLLNSCLNGTGKYGARSGNAAGVLALLYTLTERQLEDAEVDRLPGALNNLAGRDVFPRSRADGVLTAAAAFSTGALFALPRAISMRGVDRMHVGPGKRAAVVLLGGIAACAGVGALATASPLIFGERSPFRFA